MGTYTQGAQTNGSTPGAARDVGYNVLAKVVDIQAGGAASADFTTYLPDGAELIDVILDSVTAHTSATATVAVGTTVGGTELASATDVKTTARTRPTFTAAQLTQAQAIPHTSGQPDTPIYLRLALTTPTSVGLTKAILVYAPKLN